MISFCGKGLSDGPRGKEIIDIYQAAQSVNFLLLNFLSVSDKKDGQ